MTEENNNGGEKRLHDVSSLQPKKTIQRATEDMLRGPTNDDYLRWVRNTANDIQILSIRDELRSLRESNAELHGDVGKMQQAHTGLQADFRTMLRVLGFLLWKYARPVEVGDDASEIVLDVSKQDIASVDGKNLDIAGHESGDGWQFAVAERLLDTSGGEHPENPPAPESGE